MILSGCVAPRTRGRIEWDTANLRITNNPEANDYPRRECRKCREL